MTSEPTRVVLEAGRTWTFASALDWPGWCRRGKGEEAALETLLDYADRYALVAGPGFDPGPVHVVERVPGNATTDFGAPDARCQADREPVDDVGTRRLAELLDACWRRFDAIVTGAPAVLRKGPRGGGRDRDAVVDHVREAERTYGRRIGVRVPPRTPWPEQRRALVTTVTAGAPDARDDWPLRYAVRRLAWHVLDHAWEVSDRSA